MKHGDGISLTSPVPDAFPGRGRCGDGVGTFPKRFREVRTAKVFGDGEVRFWKRFLNVSDVNSVSFSRRLVFYFLCLLV
ncbi:hypothetical protein Bca4012_055535 [Brassica carinata]